MAASFSNDTGRVVIRAAVGLAAPLLLAVALALMASPDMYLWLKSVHVAAVIGWIGGMLGRKPG